MVRLPRVEHGVYRSLVVEITVTPIERHQRRRDRHEHRSGAAADHLVACAGRDDDHLMSEPRRGAQLGLDIGAHAPAGGRVKSTNVDNAHRLVEDCPGR